MAFVEYVPGLKRKYNPSVAFDLRDVKSHWKRAHEKASDRLKKFSEIASVRLSEYPLDLIDLTAIQASLTYEESIDRLYSSFRDPNANRLARGIEQRYDASHNMIKSFFNNVGNPLFGKSEHQEAYLLHAQEIGWVISQSYREGEDINDHKRIGAQVAVHLNVMHLLREGKPVNVSNLV